MTPEAHMLATLTTTHNFGTFEGHITIRAAEESVRERFQQVCLELGVKPVLIDLPEGVEPSQPMTSSYHRGSVQQAAEELARLAQQLRERDFPILRVKLEAVTTNEGIPELDTDSQAPECYFEFHVKLLLPANANEMALRSICDCHAGRLSRNAFKNRSDGCSERFVTLRVYGVGRITAEAQLDALVNSLTTAGFDVMNKQKEYALFDSHIQLDAGWIPTPSEGRP